jgi:hypothetical protein
MLAGTASFAADPLVEECLVCAEVGGTIKRIESGKTKPAHVVINNKF